jgi:hypothetical protein
MRWGDRMQVRTAKVGLALCISLMMLGLTGCIGGHIITVQGALQAETAAAAKETTQPSAKRSHPAHLSKDVGLGDKVEWIDKHWGKPSRVVQPLDSKEENGSQYYDHNRILVQFMNGRAMNLRVKVAAINLLQAQQLAANMVPKDVQLVNTVTMLGQDEVMNFESSQTINHLWPNRAYGGQSSATNMLTIRYDDVQGKVSSFEITIGEQTG